MSHNQDLPLRPWRSRLTREGKIAIDDATGECIFDVEDQETADLIVRLSQLPTASVEDDLIKTTRRNAFLEAAEIAIHTASHLSILPPKLREFPSVGGIFAARILTRVEAMEFKDRVDKL